MGARTPYTATFTVRFPRAGRMRNLACTVELDINPARADPSDVMPALHAAVGPWLIQHAPGMTGQDLEFVQERVDPPAGFMRLNGGLYGGGTWEQTATRPLTTPEATP